MQEALIELKDLHKTFHIKGEAFHALEGIDLTIHRGEIFGIIGMSGAGKSTLVRCINFLEKPTSGAVIFNGKDLGTLSDKTLRETRREMGMIFQQFNLLMQRTALDNVLFPLLIAGTEKEAAKKRALELLDIVGLGERAQAYPAQLSGGQKQRVAIARALATNPKVLLCDEATSALDPTTTDAILQLLRDLAQKMGITVVIITHEMRVIEKICDRVAIIADHKIAEVGSVADIFSHPKTDATKQLVYRERGDQVVFEPKGGRQLRIVFQGESSFEPVIAQMIMDLSMPVNIMFADTRNIDGRAFGQIIVQLPAQGDVVGAIEYLKNHGLQVEEVMDHV